MQKVRELLKALWLISTPIMAITLMALALVFQGVKVELEYLSIGTALGALLTVLSGLGKDH